MAVPILTIPEGAFDPSAYSASPHNKKKSQLLQYLLRLTNGSATLLVLAYIIGLFALKPLLELTATRRLDFLEKCRGKLRDLYLNAIGRVNYIPIVAINKHDGSGKLYADAICQTDDLKDDQDIGSLGQDAILTKLQKLSALIEKCLGFLVKDMDHYRVIDFALKDLQQKTDLTIFNQRELFSGNSTGPKTTKKNLALDVKNEIRGIKGMYMSGQV